jgi:uncharacterized membrane protein
MTLLDRFLTLSLYALAVLLIAGMVHILSILLMPYVAAHDGFARLAPLGPPGELVLLPRTDPAHQVAPFTDPAVAEGVCVFDLDKGPLALRGDLQPGGLVTLSFRTRSGRIFYSMTDKATQHGAVDIRVVTSAQREELEGNDDDQEPLQELRLVSPEKTGYVLIGAFVPFPSAWPESEAQLKAITCSAEPIVESREGVAPGALSSETDARSHQENASEQKSGAAISTPRSAEGPGTRQRKDLATAKRQARE